MTEANDIAYDRTGEAAQDAAGEAVNAPPASIPNDQPIVLPQAQPQVAAGLQPPGPAPTIAPPATQSAGPVTGWLQHNRWFTKEPISYAGYQFVRAGIASVPYMFGMAAAQHGFTYLSAIGQKMGLTQKGIDTFTRAAGEKTSGLAAVEKAALEHRGAIFKAGNTAMAGRQLMRLGNSPMNAAMQVALGFTLFRFTGGIVKNIRDRVMDEKNTDADTQRETHHVLRSIGKTAAVSWQAESGSTPIAALVLGFMGAAFTPAPESIARRDKVKYPGLKGFAEQVVGKDGLWSKKSKLLQHMAVWTLAYSLFFQTAELLFKDIQLRRGLWKGHPNSVKNAPDDAVGGPGAVAYKTPEDDEAIPAMNSAEEGYRTQEKDKDASAAKDEHQKLRYPFLTSDPGIGRFAFRRVLPVAVGISAYAALKRVGYLAAGGTMKQITVPELEKLKTLGDHGKFFMENAKREGIATCMFGSLWWATDAWGSWYDKFCDKLQKPENAVPLNEKQQANHASLLERLNAKEQAQGRAA